MNRQTARPILLAIGGDSGTGKTTIARGLYHLFGRDNIVSICLDDYHRLDRKARQKAGVTALNPAANNIELMEEHIWALREGKSIIKPVYDHSTGTFGEPERVEPKPWVVVRGLFPLFSERLREAFDVRVWLDPDDELKYHWKVERDVAQRGYTVEQVIRQIVERQDDLRRYILPQRAHADIVVRFYPPAGYFQAVRARNGNGHAASSNGVPGLSVRLGLKATVPAPGVAELLAGPESPAAPDQGVADSADGRGAQEEIRVSREASGEWISVDIAGHIHPERAEAARRRLLNLITLEDAPADALGVFLADGKTPRRSDTLTLTQLVIACQLVAVRDALEAAALHPVGRRSGGSNGRNG